MQRYDQEYEEHSKYEEHGKQEPGKTERAPFGRTIFVCTAACCAVLCALYAYWLFTAVLGTMLGVLVSALACMLFAFVGANALRDMFLSFTGAPETDITATLGRRSMRPGHRHPVLKVFLAVLLFRLAVYILAYILLVLQKGYPGALLDTLGLWLRGDAPHYMGIADNWYVTEGDPRFHIVFFPLYPLLVRLVNFVAGNTFVAGLFVSVVCTAVAGILLYELALLDMDRRSAKRAVKFQMLLPAAFLLNAPMSDGLFLLLTLATMLLARKKRYVLACLMGGLAAFTRVLGVVLLAPVLVELIADVIRMKKRGARIALYLPPRIVALLMIPMGLLLYIVINYDVTGDPFKFLYYQSTHWNQQMGFFFNTAAYQTDYFLGNIVADPPAAWGLWFPNLFFLLLAPFAVLLATRKRKTGAPEAALHLFEETAEWPMVEQPYGLRPSYTVYFLAYYVAGMGATWLLSAPRYLTCCFPLPIALASLVKRRGVLLLLYIVLFLLQMLYMAAYVAGWPVY